MTKYDKETHMEWQR